VRDTSGAVIAGASVSAIEQHTGTTFRRDTTATGDYVFANLPIGTYTVVFNAYLFRELRVSDVQTHVSTVLRQDAVLDLASASSTAEVRSSTPLVKTETAEIGQLVDSRQMTQLPLNGRNIFSLLALSAGAETGISPAARFTSLERPAIAGGRAGYTVFRLNGVDINSQNLPSASVVPAVDAVEEFRAITQLAPASNSSTSSVNVAIRGGTNQFHGVAYEFFRNNVLDAHSFFQRTLSAPGFRSQPDQLRYHQFGGALGGPLKENQTFFFFNTQITRSRTETQISTMAPTAQMLEGDFSGINPLSGAGLQRFSPVIDPATQQPFPGNRVPAALFSPFAQKFKSIGGFLPANCLACQAAGLGFNLVGEAPAHADQNQYIGRLDHRFSDNDTLFGAFQIQSGVATSVPSPNPISVMETPTRAYAAALDEIHTFSSNTVNELRVGYTRLRQTLQQQQDAQGAFTFQNTPTSLPSLYPSLIFIGYPQTFGNGVISDRNFSLEDSWDFEDSITHARGAHEFGAGFELIRARFGNTVNLNALFVYADNQPGVLGFTGNSFADFLIGVPFVGVTFQGTGRAPMVHRSVYAGYIQDNWRISRRLTLNAGLRYEFPQRWRDVDNRLNRLATLDTGAASRALGGRFLLAGSPDYYVPGLGVIQGSGFPLIRASLIDPSWQDFQPRVGLAYRPFRDNTTAIRAGFGIYYALPDANSVAQELTSPPFSYQARVANLPPFVPFGQPLRDTEFWPATPPAGVATAGNDPRNRDPRLYEWTFSLEHQISNSILLSAEYLGNHGTHNPLSTLINAPDLPDSVELAVLKTIPALDQPLALLRSPFPNVGLDYQYVQNIAPSWYNALNLKAEGRFGNRLNFSAAYTWSKALDWESAEQQLPGVTSNLALGKSYADFDHPHRFVGSWIYDLPSFRHGWKPLVNGWELTGIATFEAGPPYSITMGVDTSFRGGAAPVFPNLNGRPVTVDVRKSNGIYLTPRNFTAPAFGALGGLTRNAFHGPGINNFDLGVIKSLPLREDLRLQFRAEMFNAFNHAQFAFGGASLASSIAAPAAGATEPSLQYVDPSHFGRASARPPRVVQFAMKLVW
jgi:hypothetical protein